MALLDTVARGLVTAHLMRRDGVGSVGTLTKANLRAAVDATDQWIEDNSTAFNTAIPLPARTQLNSTQKTLLFCYVAMRRGGVLRTEGE